MKKTLLLLISLIFLSYSEIQIGLGAGYGLPINKRYLGYSYEKPDDTLGLASIKNYESVWGSFGKGLKTNFNIIYYRKKIIGIVTNVGISALGNYTIERLNAEYNCESTYKSSFVYGSLGLAGRFYSGKNEIMFQIGPAVCYPYSVKSRIESIYSDENHNAYPDQEINWKEYDYNYSPSVGVHSGISFSRKIRKSINISFSIRASIFEGSLKGYNYRDETIDTYVSLDNIDEPTALNTSNIANSLDDIQMTFSSIDFLVGFAWSK